MLPEDEFREHPAVFIRFLLFTVHSAFFLL